MSFDSIERSAHDAKSFELYLFAIGETEYPLTNEDAAIAFNGRTYEATTIHREEIELSQEQSSGQVKIEIPKSHPLAAIFIPYLPAVPVTLTIYLGHYGDPEIVATFVGKVASARYPDECELTCVSERDDLKRRIPNLLYQSTCPRVFGDAGCSIPLAGVTYEGDVDAVDSTGTIVTIGAFASLPFSLRAGFLRRGDDVRLIAAHSGGTITLLTGISQLKAGDHVSGTAGCAKTYAACVAFGNLDNFLGFDMIPTRNPFDGSITPAGGGGS